MLNSMATGALLREVEDGDLPILFEHWNDPEANRMAAFTAPDRREQGVRERTRGGPRGARARASRLGGDRPGPHDLVHEAVLLRLFRGHEAVTIDVRHHFLDRLAGVLREDLGHPAGHR